MINLNFNRVFQICVLAVFSAAGLFAQDVPPSSKEERYANYQRFYSLVRGGRVIPNWMSDGNSFWFADGAPENTIIYKVDSKNNTKTPLFDTARLRKALTPLLGHEPAAAGVPFTTFTFEDGEKKVRFTVENKEFLLNPDNYEISAAAAAQPGENKDNRPGETRFYSPDRKKFIFSRDNNLWIGSSSSGKTEALTVDGIKDYSWDDASAVWSPDGKKLFASKTDNRKVHHLPIINYSKPVEEVEWRLYAKSGEAIAKSELYVLDAESKQASRIAVDGGEEDQYFFLTGWLPDNSEVIFMKMDREAKKLDLMATSVGTGASRVILSEQQKTFVGGLDFLIGNWTRQFTLLKDGKQFIWMSERDGWNHLYLYDINGKLVRRLTEGTFPVIRVAGVDEKKNRIYFTANAEPKLYDTNLYSINFEGKDFKKLTAADGRHAVEISPSKDYFVDSYSSPVNPPIVELRNTDGRLLQTLASADISSLKKIGWNPPEEFIVKATDNKTDLYGTLYKPYDFDPNKKYPVIEFIYAGPFMTAVPHVFLSSYGLPAQAQAVAQLGFITFVVDSRGTTERGKAFQDAIYGNIGRYEIPDHVAALKQLAEKHPFMDLNRVGIYGHSWGGYFALRAMLTAPDVYKAGIASAPGDLTEAPEINEPYMGLPKNNREGYEYGSNPKMAANLKGKLLLIHGTSDGSAPFSTTVRMIEALIQAGKPYNLVILPQQDHGIRGISAKYWTDTIRHYFEENLTP